MYEEAKEISKDDKEKKKTPREKRIDFNTKEFFFSLL